LFSPKRSDLNNSDIDPIINKIFTILASNSNSTITSINIINMGETITTISLDILIDYLILLSNENFNIENLENLYNIIDKYDNNYFSIDDVNLLISTLNAYISNEFKYDDLTLDKLNKENDIIISKIFTEIEIPVETITKNSFLQNYKANNGVEIIKTKINDINSYIQNKLKISSLKDEKLINTNIINTNTINIENNSNNLENNENIGSCNNEIQEIQNELLSECNKNRFSVDSVTDYLKCDFAEKDNEKIKVIDKLYSKIIL